jgi:hypothetical protein
MVFLPYTRKVTWGGQFSVITNSLTGQFWTITTTINRFFTESDRFFVDIEADIVHISHESLL